MNFSINDKPPAAMTTAPLEDMIRSCLEFTVAAQPEDAPRFFACAAARMAGVRATHTGAGREKGLPCELPWGSALLGDELTGMGRAAARSMATETGDFDDPSKWARSCFEELRPVIEDALHATLKAGARQQCAPTAWTQLLAEQLLTRARCAVKEPPDGARPLPVDAQVQCCLPWSNASDVT